MKKIVIILGGAILVFITLYLLRKMITDKIIEFIILKNEGGYVSPEQAKKIGDTGGETKYGISKKWFPELDIKNLTMQDAINIYRNKYLSKLPYIENPALLYQVLDMAINAGPSVAKSIYKNGMTVEEYKKRRLAKYATFKLWSNEQVKKSWTNRTLRNYA